MSQQQYYNWSNRTHGLYLDDGVYSNYVNYDYYAGDELNFNNIVYKDSKYVIHDNSIARFVNRSNITLYDTSGISIFDGGTLTISTSADPVSRGFIVDEIGRVGIGMRHVTPVGSKMERPSFDLDVRGTIGTEDYIYHKDDTDTYMLFGSDQTTHFVNVSGVPDLNTTNDFDEINFRVGGVDMLQMVENTSQSQVVFNKFREDVDFIVKSLSADPNENIVDVGTDGGIQEHLPFDPESALFVNGENGRVGIGTDSPSTTLHIAGSAHIEGDLWVKGNMNRIDTLIQVTSAVEVSNKGTGPALTIEQTGEQPIATFIDDGKEILHIEDGGNIGVQTIDPHTTFYINTTDGLRIPTGTTNQRPLSGDYKLTGDPETTDFTPMQGTIRYNTEYSTFEGFGAGNVWGSLAHGIDIDRDTFWTALNDLSASDYPGDPDTLRAFVGNDQDPNATNGTHMMSISLDRTIVHRGRMGIRETNPDYTLHLVSPDSMTAVFETSLAESTIGIKSLNEQWDVGAGLGGKFSIKQTTTTEERFVINSIGNVGIGTSAPSNRFQIKTTGLHYAAHIQNDNSLGGGLFVKGPNFSDDQYVTYLEGNAISNGLYVKAGGRVGMGVTNPKASLHIKPRSAGANTTETSPVFIDNAANTVSLFLGELTDTSTYGANAYTGVIRFNGMNQQWGDFSHYPTGGDSGEAGHFRFSRTGGTVNTTPNAKVGVGEIYATDMIGVRRSDARSQVDVGSTAYNSTNWLYRSTSDVGLLFSSPYSTSNPYHGGVFWRTTNSTLPKAGMYMYADGGGSSLRFGTSGSYNSGITNTALTISPNGYVGINDTTPSFHLDVNGAVAIRNSNSLYFYTSIGSQRGRIFAKEGSPHLNIWTSGGEDISLGDGSNILFIDGTNNRVGINTTTPQYELDVRGNMRLGDGTTGEQDIYFISANGSWQVGTNNGGNGGDNNQFYVYDNNYNPQAGHDGYSLAIQKRTGNVGIGTGTPSAKLELMGSNESTTMIRVGRSTNGTQGTGVLELTQDGLAGGGISYNGDLNPTFATGEGADYTCLYRMSNGARHVVSKWSHSSNRVTFTGEIEMQGGYLYSDGWFTNRQAMEGLYNTSTGTHLYAQSSRFWDVAFNSGEASGGIQLRRGWNGQSLGFLYGNSDLDFGLLDAGGSWMMRHVNDSHIVFSNGGAVNFSIGANAVTGDYGTVQTSSTGKGGWAGYSINGRVTLMHNNASEYGIYNDVDNKWMIKGFRNSSLYLYHDSSQRLQTTSSGIKILQGSSGYGVDISGTTNEKIVLSGASNPYIRWQEGTTNRAYIQFVADQNSMLYRNQQSMIHEFRGNNGADIKMMDDAGNYLGSLYANSTKEVGILDSDHDWAIRHVPNSKTEFRINNVVTMDVQANGLHFPSGKHIYMNNCNITGVNSLTINDTREGISFGGGNGWHIYESPNSLADSAGNIQIVQGSTRRATFNTSGQLELPIGNGTAPLVVSSSTKVDNLNADSVDGYQASSLINNTHTYNSRTNLPIGWYTIAVNAGDRCMARFGIRDVASSRHQTHVFYASHHYNSAELTHIAGGLHGTSPFRYLRIKTGGTYDGALLQVYIDNSSNSVNAYMLGDNIQSGGWTLVNWVADGTNPGTVNNFAALNTENCKLDLDHVNRGGISTTGNMYAGGNVTQYRVLTSADQGSGSGNDCDTVDGLEASQFVRSDTSDTMSGLLTISSNNEKIRLSDTSASGSPYISFYQGGTRRGYIQYADSTESMIIYNDTYDDYLKIHSGSTGLKWNYSGTDYTVWHSGNDGAGSGLDADMLDGLSSGSFVRSDASDTMGGDYTFTGGAGAITITNSDIRSNATSTWTGNPGTQGKIQYHSNRWYIVADSASNRICQFRRDGADKSYVDNNGKFIGDTDMLDGLHGSSYVQTANNTSLNSDTRNTRGPTRLYRRDSDSDYSVQTNWTGTYWHLRGYSGDSFHAECQVGYANNAGWADTVDVNPSNSGGGNYELVWCSGDTVYSSDWFYINRDAKTLYCSGDIIAYASDERLKENITLIQDPLEKLSKINGYTFNFNEKGSDVVGQPRDRKQVGVLAQEIEQVLPEVIESAPGDNEYKTVKYDKIVPLLIESIKEQQKQIEELKHEVAKLKQQ